MYQIVSNDIVLNLENKTNFPPIITNREGRKYLKWVEEGNTPLPQKEIEPRAPTYKEQRAEEYNKELSTEGTFEMNGDLLEALIDAIYGDKTKLDTLKITIDQIKAKYPRA